jgi:SAM-dependent methyltransferase/Flp pilus assembly protein TadD
LFREALSCQQSGNFQRAEALYRQILATPAADADAPYLLLAHYNLGSALQEAGRLAEAEACYLQALQLRPDFPEAHFNLAVVALHQRHFEQAASAAARTASLRPDLAVAHDVLGMAQTELGQHDAAFRSFRSAVRLDPRTPQFWENWAACLAQYGVPAAAVDSSLFSELCLLLERPEIEVRTMMRPMLWALINHADLGKIIPAVNRGEDVVYAEIAERLSAISLLIRLMGTAAVEVPAVEGLLTALRRMLLQGVSGGAEESRGLPFSTSLALQCFLNEYVFTETADESSAIEWLHQEIGTRLDGEAEISAAWIAALGAYRPLHHFRWAGKLLQRPWPADIRAVLVAQVAEPQEEEGLRGTIPHLTPIADPVSHAVRGQYESNPYPRWTRPVLCEPRPVVQVLRDLLPHIEVDGQTFGGNLDVLVAGCGTGMNALHVASRFARARVLAIDLSLRSLAYALRKTRQLGFTNIDYGQADILDLRSLGRQFDLIDCMGVLHHLGDPLVGWRALADSLRSGGLMRIGLYSELGRRGVVRARAMIAEKGYSPTSEHIRRFRQEILAMDPAAEPDVVALINGDLHTMSECRDLLFHVQEHRYTLPQIEDSLKVLGLRFLGFEIPNAESQRLFRRRHPEPQALASLSLWHLFEQENPRTFSAMYQFWCCKA